MRHGSHPRLSRTAPLPREVMLQRQQQSLQALLRYVWKYSAFYREYYRSHGIQERDLPDVTVQDLPFTSKQLLMQHFDRVVTDARLRKRELAQWLQEHRNPHQFFHKDFVVLHSSGTSGHIGIFVYDRVARQVMNTAMAARLHAAHAAPQRVRAAFYLASHSHFSGVTTAAEMSAAAHDVLILSVLDAPEGVLARLNAFQPERLDGYPSAIAELAQWALRGKLRIRPRQIFVGGEHLTDRMAQDIREAWAAPLYNLYGCSESRYLAVQGPHQEAMEVLDELNVLEILGEAQQAVAAGESGRVVLTNLYNHALPVLRYELGDHAVRGEEQASCTIIQRIQGRVSERLPVLLHDGRQDVLPRAALDSFFVAGLERIQFIAQRPEHLRIDYVAERHIDAQVREEFQRILQARGATRTTFDVRRVARIAHDPQTGKLRPVVVEKTHTAGGSAGMGLRLPSEIPPPDRIGPQNPFTVFDRAHIEQSIPARFEAQVQQYADRLALKDEQQSFTYAALNRAANRLAYAILAACDDREEPVALLFEHGALVMVGIMGALKAGKIYVPLDATYPYERLVYLLEDARPRLLVTNHRNLALARQLARPGCQVLNIEALPRHLRDDNPALCIAPDRLANITYTSGSTGRPKGVLHNHRNILHMVMNYTNNLHVSAEDRLTLVRSASFSGSLRNIFGALLNGAALLPFDVKDAGLARLAAWLLQEGITIYQSGATLFRHFVDTLTGDEAFPRLRLVYVGAEPAYRSDVESYKRHFADHCLFVCGMGLTEAATLRIHFIDKTTLITHGRIPIGYAVEDMEVLLLDAAGRDVGFDQVGEIVVRSAYLSPGYWRQPELTRAVFEPDPEDGNRRRYRTGDMGLLHPDGCLEHLGRKDEQVNIRGHRIETTEIEAALLALDGVKEAAVAAREDHAGELRLVAYVVPSTQPAPSSRSLRLALREKLPEAMIPSAFVLLDALPLNPNGKVDRHALPEPVIDHPEGDRPFVAPRTPVERALAELWSGVLGIERIGVHDDFLDLGGHSLTAMQLVVRVRETLNVEFSLRTFFESPTVAATAAAITQGMANPIE